MCYQQMTTEQLAQHLETTSQKLEEAKEVFRKAFKEASRAVKIAQEELGRPKTKEPDF